METLLAFARRHWFYSLLVLLGFGTFIWANLTGRRLLGDDNESTENINGTRSHSGGRSGHGVYYHK
ncbi:hypothetical protein [Hymenobacter sp. CRA2]|uniref:hypothetical protein n=1 Tax=Hymenobacter sp. CRA2 TaxID=1955620 RepID=UPI00098EA881|nr:hypothetical protein [Hymenobacter sp. CRA2]OON66486.1 hypothetical protein B0919_21895 [Hymenobacter sp. CRA2]